MADSETGLPNDPDELTTRSFKLPRLGPDSANLPAPDNRDHRLLAHRGRPGRTEWIGTPANRRLV